MSRELPEWIGRTDDSKVPPRVRQRIFEREGGICHITGQKIAPGDAWQLDHRVPLILGGSHKESNLFPALVEPHKRKTATEMKVKSKIARIAKKHMGIKKEKTFGLSKRFKRRIDGRVVDRETGEIV